VFDRFHIERYLTQAIDEVRKQEFFRRGGMYRDAIRGFLQRWRRLLNWSRLRGRSAATPRAFSRAMRSFATTPSV
jgi:hypothetical protein